MHSVKRLGATYLGDNNTRFVVWVPHSHTAEVHIISPEDRLLALEMDDRGYFAGEFDDVKPGSLYYYRLDGEGEYPDPASHFQPEGVHGPSKVVDTAFEWTDKEWRGLPLEKYIIYEAHIGALTHEGTFEAAIPLLDELVGLGVTALEVMPVAQFPGNRNWGYDGAYPFAVQGSYGGPDGFKTLADACHEKKIAVVLDVVFNHIGPEGNCFGMFGPYFTERYATPWGKAVNFDGPFSDEVRRFFIENALYWFSEFHVDALRLDALHAIFDSSAIKFLDDLVIAVEQLAEQSGRRIYLIGESDANDRKLILSRQLGGYGLDAQWNEDFHHSLHALLTGERSGYYQDFGKVEQMAKATREGFVYSGEYSQYRKRRHGSYSGDIPGCQFVVFGQNHDQTGNRMLGERLSRLVCFEALKLAAGAVLLSPYIPLIFMGEEYGETAPFQYFTSHSDPALIKAVREGRRKEFAGFEWKGEVPDPQDESTFLRSKLDRNLRFGGEHRILNDFYRKLITLRIKHPALACSNKGGSVVSCDAENKILCSRRWNEREEVAVVYNFGETESSFTIPLPKGDWKKELDSADTEWLGKGSSSPTSVSSQREAVLKLQAFSLALFTRGGSERG